MSDMQDARKGEPESSEGQAGPTESDPAAPSAASDEGGNEEDQVQA